jgi:ribonuclease H / adenosylcobalamin/alpha-ribazole phosphatase
MSASSETTTVQIAAPAAAPAAHANGPRGRTTIHLVRHGRTALNAQGRYRGLDDPPLDDEGLGQAEGAARELSARPIAAVYHSSLARARQTAEAIARVTGVEPRLLVDLVDLDLGLWTAKTPGEAGAIDPEAFARFRDDPRACTPPGGEPIGDVERRVVAALDELGRRHAGTEVVAVSHEIPIRLLVSRLAGLDGPDVWRIDLPTGSIATVSGASSAWRLEGWPGAPLV